VIRTDFAGLRGALERAAAGRRIVGFDVFDTLVRRRVEPETVKDRIAVMLAERLGRRGEWRALRARRAALERALYEERVRGGQDGEFTLQELVERWLAEVAPTGSDLVSETIAAELALERKAQALAPAIGELIPMLAAAGKRLLFVSDMYLPAADIRGLLDGLGIGPYFAAGYVSCDHGRRKTTGRLFAHLLEHEGIAPEELVFVGDNLHADVEPARGLGITVVHVQDPRERKRRLALQVAEWAAGRSPLWQGELANAVVETIPGRVRAGRSPHYDLGLTLAPAFVAFMLHVVERVQADALREVYFLSREGWLLLRLYRRLTRALGLAGTLPRGRYLFASRLATFLPGMARLDWPELHRMWRQYDRQSVRLLFANLGLPADEFAPLARRAGLEDLDAPLADPEHDARVRRFLADDEVARRFTVHRDAARAALRAYLAQIGLFGARAVGFVDVGWKGTIQQNICRAFADEPAFPVIHGLYLAAHPLEAPVGGTISGFLADGRRRDHLVDRILHTPTPFEMTASAAHGSVAGYDRPPHRGGRVVPRLVGHEAERRAAPHLREAARAVEDYLADFVACLGLFDLAPEALRPAATDRVLRCLRYPTRREAEVFGDYAHVESFGIRGVTTFRPRHRLRGALRALWPRWVWLDFWRRVDDELWPELALRQGRVPLGQALYDLRRTLREIG
jgi:FMN phosphatase YigB (HAD superfamily)